MLPLSQHLRPFNPLIGSSNATTNMNSSERNYLMDEYRNGIGLRYQSIPDEESSDNSIQDL